MNSTPAEAIDTRGIAYNRVAMEALLEEPEVEQPNITGAVDIPEASGVYFDAENVVGDDRPGRGPEEEATVEAEGELALEEVGAIDDGDSARGSEGADEEGGSEEEEEAGENKEEVGEDEEQGEEGEGEDEDEEEEEEGQGEGEEGEEE